MKKIMGFLLFTGFLATSGRLAMSQESTAPLSFDQALSEGMGDSPTIKKYQSAADQSKWESYLGLSTLLPHIELKAKHDFTAQYENVPVNLNGAVIAVPVVFPETSFAAEAQWTLFDGLGNLNKYKAGQSNFQASEKELSRKNFEVRKRIELSFFNALAARRFEEVAQENVKTLQENLRQVQSRFNNGVSTKYDVLRIEVQLTDATTELERTHDNVVIQRRLLAQAMGNVSDERDLNGDLPVPNQIQKIESLGPPDINAREDFQAEELKSQAADQLSKAAQGALVPSIGIAAQYENYEDNDYPGEAYGGFRNAWSVGVFMKWTLLDGGETIAKSGIAKASAERAVYEYRESVLSLPADYELWKRRYVYSAHRYALKSTDVQRSQESLRISEVSFQQGRKTITDVLEAETDLFRARASVVQSQLDAEEALVKLELTLGRDI